MFNIFKEWKFNKKLNGLKVITIEELNAGNFETTLNLDIELATKKIVKEMNETQNMARAIANQLKNYHPALFPFIEGWYNGNEQDVEFQGITISYIMEKERDMYLPALSTLSGLLKRPNEVEDYKKWQVGWK